MSRLRRLMANDMAYGLVLLAFVATVVAWVYWPHGHGRTVVQTVLMAPPATPLPRDSGPKNNTGPKVRQRSSQRNRTTESPSERHALSVRSQNRPLPTLRRKTGRTKPKRHRAPQKLKRPPQASSPAPPPPKQCPPVTLTVPVPVTVTTPIVGVNC